MLHNRPQEWYGYTDNNDTTSAKTVTMYLPDRDPEPKAAGGEALDRDGLGNHGE